jgi:glutamate/tyrosine decarboxylase-like PLP-dependent enzyme
MTTSLGCSTGKIAAFDELRRTAERVHAEIANGPIVPQVTAEQIRGHLASYDFQAPVALDVVVSDVEQMLRDWQVQVTHPRYLGLFNPSVTTASVVADALAAMYNPQLATWRTSPAANEIERHTLAWLAGKFGLPTGTHANFTTGGAEANTSAVIVSLARAFPEYLETGLMNLAKTPTIYLTGGAHHGFLKTARMVGLGSSTLRTVGMDGDLKMNVDALARQVAEDRRAGFAPFLVVGNAGSTAAGVIDPLPEIARFCEAQDLWFHVDAAWGGAAAISPRLRPCLEGIELADSITCDAHKWFSVSMGAGMFFCRHPQHVYTAFESEISFMPRKTGDNVDPYSSTLQWSRRFIGLKLFLSLAERGEGGYTEMIERQAHMGDVLRAELTRTGWRIVNKTPFPLVCFTRDGLVPSEFLRKLFANQIAWMSEVNLNERGPALRACVTSFHTTEPEIKWIVEQMNTFV